MKTFYNNALKHQVNVRFSVHRTAVSYETALVVLAKVRGVFQTAFSLYLYFYSLNTEIIN